MSVDVKDKVVVVTGANRGIGKSIVESFIEHGASKVYLAVRDTASTKELEGKFGSTVVTIQTDISDREAVFSLAKQAADADIVVNNAGVLAVADPLSDDATVSLRYELDVNVFGLLNVAQAFAPILQEKAGAFVQLNSIASIKNFTPLSTYSASKAAAYSITQGLRETLAASGVHVLSVHPGPIDTDMSKSAGMEMETFAPTEVSEGIVSALAAGAFHLFPDPVAKQLEAAYQSYSDAVITAEMAA